LKCQVTFADKTVHSGAFYALLLTSKT